MELANFTEKANSNTTAAWRLNSIGAIYGLALVLTALGTGRLMAATGDYTQAQATTGHQVFSQHCAKCHGSNLKGQSGPPLAGKKFKSNLEYSKMTAQQLFAFIKSQMPYDAPGSLSKDQYLQAMAYILSKNGYPQGSAPLSEKTLPNVKLLPYPGSGGAQGHQANSKTQ